MIKGYTGALFELFLFFKLFSNIMNYSESFKSINPIVSYWLGFTVLTGFWELVYVTNKKEINEYANHLIANNKSVWFSDYNFTMIFPHNFSKLFYSEYAAWADREYMSFSDNWSITIEGSHCILCGLFSLVALWSLVTGHYNNFLLALGITMGSQFMNSLLYLSEYMLQTKDINNINYNNKEFPTGEYLLKRSFMYVNILWLILPAYSILSYVEL